jgi:hypothetical protein
MRKKKGPGCCAAGLAVKCQQEKLLSLLDQDVLFPLASYAFNSPVGNPEITRFLSGHLCFFFLVEVPGVDLYFVHQQA